MIVTTKHDTLDHLGSPRLVTDGYWGYKLARHDYYPFGLEATDPSQDAEPTRFTGQETDRHGSPGQADDLINMHARFYHPTIARFLSADFLRGNPHSPQSFNLFAYVRGNPTNYWDPLGLTKAVFRGTVRVNATDPLSEFFYWYFFGGPDYLSWSGVSDEGGGGPRVTKAPTAATGSQATVLNPCFQGGAGTLGGQLGMASWLERRIDRFVVPVVVGNASIVSGGVVFGAGLGLTAASLAAAPETFGLSLVGTAGGAVTALGGAYLMVFGVSVDVNAINNWFGLHLWSPSQQLPQLFP